MRERDVFSRNLGFTRGGWWSPNGARPCTHIRDPVPSPFSSQAQPPIRCACLWCCCCCAPRRWCPRPSETSHHHHHLCRFLAPSPASPSQFPHPVGTCLAQQQEHRVCVEAGRQTWHPTLFQLCRGPPAAAAWQARTLTRAAAAASRLHHWCMRPGPRRGQAMWATMHVLPCREASTGAGRGPGAVGARVGMPTASACA